MTAHNRREKRSLHLDAGPFVKNLSIPVDIRNSSGPALLPPQIPPKELLMDLDEIEFAALTDTQLGVALWTAAVALLFEWEAPWKKVVGYRFAAFGFTDPDYEADAFGAVIFATPGLHLEQERIWLEWGEFSFPVFVRRSVEMFHAPKVHPTGGTATCWAESGRIASGPTTGLLTAKHLIPNKRIGQLTSTNSGYGRILDIAPDGIDAALIEAPHSPGPTPQTVLRASTNVVPWTDVQIESTASGPIATKITLVTDTRGSLSPSIPARIFLASHGFPGDSGALVRDANGVGVGIYMGEMADMAGRAEGICQHLAQAAQAMNLTLYE